MAARRALRVLLPTLGSSGDVNPVVGLALALQARGHQATVITNEIFAEQVRASGLAFLPLGTLQEAEEAISDPRLWHPMRAFDCIAERLILPNLVRLYRMIERLRDPDTVVVASGLCLGARVARDKLGVPLATVHLQPALLRSLEDGGMLGRLPMGPRVPRLIKQSCYWLVDRLLIDRLLSPRLDEFRAALGLAPVRGVLKDYIHSPDLVIGLFPEWFARPQRDWPLNTHLTGFVLNDGSSCYGMAPEAEHFLAAGPPPVVFTPGSGAATLRGFFRESVEACRLAGLRGMLVTNFPGQLPEELPDNVRAFGYLPFGRLLPRCAAVVYPGGIGTLAQAVHAGIPQLVVPHAHDQPDNAARVERLGLGYRIYAEQYRSNRAAGLLAELLASSAVRERCRAHSARIDSARALEAACDLIERLGSARAS